MRRSVTQGGRTTAGARSGKVPAASAKLKRYDPVKVPCWVVSCCGAGAAKKREAVGFGGRFRRGEAGRVYSVEAEDVE